MFPQSYKMQSIERLTKSPMSLDKKTKDFIPLYSCSSALHQDQRLVIEQLDKNSRTWQSFFVVVCQGQFRFVLSDFLCYFIFRMHEDTFISVELVHIR